MRFNPKVPVPGGGSGGPPSGHGTLESLGLSSRLGVPWTGRMI